MTEKNDKQTIKNDKKWQYERQRTAKHGNTNDINDKKTAMI